jgi:hypothetical protein
MKTKGRAMRLNAIGSVLAIVILCITGWLRLPETFGAHPLWAQKALVVGGAIGIIGASGFAVFAPKLRLLIPLAVFDSIFFFGVAAAYFGKMAFAQSYGENSLAGLFWFVGWFAIAAGFAGLIATAARYYRRSDGADHE